ncbi:hypothetical protein VB776_11075 [Arcicella sp. DC2W]|uniref:Tetratricopeptide repeat protein n=1 Tax=Arcicella gelida TaxID=2984195 RepID=A0ABU5S4N0_9BACT|nr:hypothetical protein [Arcicella sp. DC2W]MEA5403459.1 hypothetical protein [Arcicella sp. DC2W]
MKKITLALFAILMTAGAASAQMDKLMVEANRKTISDAVKKADAAVTKKDSAKAKTWLTRGEAYLDLANSQDSVLTKGEPLAAYKAVEYFKKAIALEKDGAAGVAAQKYLLLTYAKDGKPEVEGQKTFSAFMNGGIAKYQAKNFAGAVKDLQMASEISPKDTTAAMYTGVIGQMAKDDEAAKAGFEKFLDLGGKDPAMIYALAQIYRNEKNEEKAISTLEKGIALHPNNKDLKSEKINLLLSFKKIDLAIKELESSVAKGNSNPQEVLNLGILYENKAQEFAPEIRSLKETLADNNADALKKKIQAQKDKVGAYDEEIKRLTDKIKKDPKSAAASKKQIASVKEMQNEQKAELTKLNEEAAKQASSGVNVEEVTKKLADLEAKQKEAKESALNFYKKSLDLDPNNYDVNFNLGVMSFNEAVEIKKKVDLLDMAAYKIEGKKIEEQADKKFREALPYFEKAYSIKQEDDLKSSLRSLYQILKMEDKLKALGE